MKTNRLLTACALRLLTACALLLGLALKSSALEVQCYCQENDKTVRTVSDSLSEDFLFAGYGLEFSGSAQDLYFVGKQLSQRGTTSRGVVALGERLQLGGLAENGIIAAGMDVVVEGTVRSSTFLAGKAVRIAQGAKVAGTLFGAGARLTIDAPVQGDLYAGAGEVIINDTISGNVVVRTGRLVIGEQGYIGGSLNYAAREPLSEAQSARVGGSITVKDGLRFDRDKVFPGKLAGLIKAIIALALFACFVTVGSLLVFLPVFDRVEKFSERTHFWRSALWGLIPLLMYPGLILLSFLLIITIPFGIVLLLAALPLLFLSGLLGTMVVGRSLCSRFGWKIRSRHGHFLLGAVAALLLSIVPGVNFLSTLLINGVGAGVLLSFLFNRNFAPKRTPPAESTH
jgi:hypothetical protein